MQTKLKPGNACIKGSVVKVAAMGEEIEVRKPLAHLYAAIVSCVMVHVKQAAVNLGLNPEAFSVTMIGKLNENTLTAIQLSIAPNQEHAFSKTLRAAAENCVVLQHLADDINVSIVVI